MIVWQGRIIGLLQEGKKLEMIGLTQKGFIMAKSTNGTSDPSDKDFSKWKILYFLKFNHFADKGKLASATGLSPASISLAIAELKRHGYVADTGQTSEV
jgi:hypothetical protein